MNELLDKNWVSAILLEMYSLWLSLKIDKVAITHLAMEIHFQTTDHVVAVEKVAEQHIATKYFKCNSLRVISHIIILGKSAITHSKVGPKFSNPLSIGHCCTTRWVKNSLEIALSLTVCKIFAIFHIFTKSSNKVATTHLCIEQQL